MTGIAGQIGGIAGDIKFPDIGKSIKEALSFENITLNLFGCDSKPNCPATDAFTLDVGGESVPDANKAEVAKNASAPNDLDDLDRATTDADRAEANRSQQELQNRSYDRPGVTVTSSATSYAN